MPRNVTEPKALRIVMAVANNPYPSDVRVRQEAEALVNAGHLVTVIAPAGPGEPRTDRVAGVDVRRYAAPPEGRHKLQYLLEYAYATWAVTVLVAWVWWRTGLDVLHVHNPPDTLFVAGLLPKLFGKRFVFDHHDLAPELFEAKFGSGSLSSRMLAQGLRALERGSCSLADRVVTVNTSYLEVDLSRNHVPRERAVVVRNGPPLERLGAPTPDPAIREGAGVVIGYLGHIAVQDGVDHLIRALHHWQRDLGREDWRAVVIGPADDPAFLRSLSEQLGVASRIRFTGYQPDGSWRSMLAAVDICCVPDPPNPLNDKSTMIKMMEYMALGKPIVAYDLAENRVSAGGAALYAAAGDPVDMARQFERLAIEPGLRERMSEVGRDRVRDHLAWEYSADRLVTMYRDLAFGVRERRHGRQDA